METVITKDQRLIIPKEICEELNLRVGQTVYISFRAGEIIIDTKPVIDRLAGSLPGAWGKDPDIYIHELRDEWAEKRQKS